MLDESRPSEITELLRRFHAGDRSGYQRLMELMYEQVKAIARRYLRDERPGHTMWSTDLVHEVYVRLATWNQLGEHRRELSALLAFTIRRVLIEHARKRLARKRREHVKFELRGIPDMPETLDLLALDEALHKLERVHKRQFQVVQLRFFLGLSMQQIADELGVKLRTVEGDWKAARLWLCRELSKDAPP